MAPEPTAESVTQHFLRQVDLSQFQIAAQPPELTRAETEWLADLTTPAVNEHETPELPMSGGRSRRSGGRTMKFPIHVRIHIDFSLSVEAETEDAAFDKADHANLAFAQTVRFTRAKKLIAGVSMPSPPTIDIAVVELEEDDGSQRLMAGGGDAD